MRAARCPRADLAAVVQAVHVDGGEAGDGEADAHNGHAGQDLVPHPAAASARSAAPGCLRALPACPARLPGLPRATAADGAGPGGGGSDSAAKGPLLSGAGSAGPEACREP